MNHIRQLLNSAPANLARLADFAEEVITARVACNTLGFDCHPVVQEVDASASRKGKHTRLVEVIYHCDGPTLFASYEWNVPRPPGAFPPLPALTADGVLQHLEVKYAVDFVSDRMHELDGALFSLKILELSLDFSSHCRITPILALRCQTITQAQGISASATLTLRTLR
jgi:hypothetical protein